MPLVVDPVMVASSGRDAARGRCGRSARGAALSARDRDHAEPLRGDRARAGLEAPRPELAEALHELGARCGDRHRRSRRPAGRPPLRRRRGTSRSRSSATTSAATHGAGCTHSATLAALLARGLPLEDAARGAARAAAEAVRHGLRELGAGDGPVDVFNLKGAAMNPGATLRRLREQKPLVHQITNYVVMNETANATLALGALPVMAHAREEVEEMAALAGALVLNIGTLSPHWVDAMLAAGRAANERGVPVVLDPVGAGATRYRTETAKRILDEVDVTVLRGNAGEVATLVGVDAEMRGVESIGGRRRSRPGLRGAAASRLGARRVGHRGRSITSPTATDVAAIANGIRCWRRSPAPAACRARSPAASSRSPSRRSTRAVEALVAFGVAGEDARASTPRARAASTSTSTTRSRRSIPGRSTTGEGRVRVHAIVEDLETAGRAVVAGATVVQLRVKGPTDEVVDARPRLPASSASTFSSTTTSMRRSSSAPTACISAGATRAPSARVRAGCCSAARRRRYAEARRGGRGLPGRRARSGTTPSKRDADAGDRPRRARARSAPPSTFR